MRPSLSVLAGWLILTIFGSPWAAAQASAPTGERAADKAVAAVPKAPRDGVLDDAHLLTAEERVRMARAAERCRRQGCGLYVAMFSFVAGEAIELRAQRLLQAWGGDAPAVIVVYENGSGQCTFLAQGALTPDLQQAFSEASRAGRIAGTKGAQLTAVIESLVPKIEERLKVERRLTDKLISRQQWNVLGGVAIACGGLGLVAWAARRLGKSSLLAAPEPAFFPTVVVEQRFGGGFGGGTVAEVRFGPRGAERSARELVSGKA